MNPTLPKISSPPTSKTLRKRVIAQLALLSVNNGKLTAGLVVKP
jgi:hypothetical protein